MGIPRQSVNGPCDNFLVSDGGPLRQANGLWTFLARHDGNVPDNWTVLDTIDNHTFDLGRWSYKSQALVVIQDEAAPGPVTEEPLSPNGPNASAAPKGNRGAAETLRGFQYFPARIAV